MSKWLPTISAPGDIQHACQLQQLDDLCHSVQSLLCSSDDEASKASMVEGRSNGRLVRRRKRIEKMRAKEAVAREERHARKELVKVTLLFFSCLCMLQAWCYWCALVSVAAVRTQLQCLGCAGSLYTVLMARRVFKLHLWAGESCQLVCKA